MAGANALITVGDHEIRTEGRLLRIARLEADKYDFLDDPAAFIQDLRRCGSRIDLFTFLQRPPEPAPKFDYPMEIDNLAVLEVSTFEHWWKEQIRFEGRNRAKQAEKKGVTLREVPFGDELVRGIWGIYNECPYRQGIRFAHYGRDVDWVRGHAGTFPDTSIFIGAFLGETMIGFIKLVTDRARTQANMMNIVAMVQHRDKAPTNALIAQAVKSCAERKISRLVYQNFVYRNKERDGLGRFKEKNGFQQMDLPRYYVPLTGWGAAAFRLGLHHRFVDRLPTGLATKLRDLRKAWFAREVLRAPGV
jgi:hypothetical protein